MFVDQQNTVKLTIVIYKVNENPIKIPLAFFTEIEKTKNKKPNTKLGIGGHAYNSSAWIWSWKTGVQGHLWLCSLSSIRPCFKKN